MQIINSIAIVIGIAGSIIIIIGIIKTAFSFLKHEWEKIAKKGAPKEKRIRYQLDSYLLLGLDFMLAADIIHTIHNPVLNELYILAMIVGIRSVISYFLHREISSPTQDE